eukprot:s2780_g11.t1
MTEAIPGADQVADVGTKVMTAPRLQELKKMMGMGKMKKREEVESRGDEAKEEKKSKEDAEKKKDEEEKKIAVAKARDLIQLAVIVGCMGQVKAEEEEEHEERAELFHAMVLFALAVIDLQNQVASSTAPVLRPPLPPDQPAEEPPRLVDEFLGSVVKEQPTPIGIRSVREKAAPQQPAPLPIAPLPPRRDTRKEAQPARPRVEEEKEKETGRRVKGPAKGKVDPEEEEAEREYEARELPTVWTPEDQRRGRGPVYVTTWGSKWHFLTTCPTLANTKVMRPGQWCSLCARWLHYDGPVYTQRPGQTVHQDPDCPRRTMPSRAYQQCQVCAEHFERTT